MSRKKPVVPRIGSTVVCARYGCGTVLSTTSKRIGEQDLPQITVSFPHAHTTVTLGLLSLRAMYSKEEYEKILQALGETRPVTVNKNTDLRKRAIEKDLASNDPHRIVRVLRYTTTSTGFRSENQRSLLALASELAVIYNVPCKDAQALIEHILETQSVPADTQAWLHEEATRSTASVSVSSSYQAALALELKKLNVAEHKYKKAKADPNCTESALDALKEEVHRIRTRMKTLKKTATSA